MGPVQTVNFVTALNVPCISPNNLKSREREIGKTIEEYALTSCKKALEEEYLMNSYNFIPGHATVIGNLSGKCLHFRLKSTDCRKCNYIDEKDDASEKDHDCRRNYSGSSNAMEPALAVEMDMLYAIKQNTSKGDIENLKSTIDAIVPHAFGDYSLCSSCENTNKLANLGSSQSNESLNFVISTKAPKSKHFGGSQSLGYRVASAVSQKNDGRNYVVEVNKTHRLYPESEREKRQKLLPQHIRENGGTKKGSRLRSVRSKEIREGDSYTSAISSIEEESPYIEEIPSRPAENDNINLHLGNTATVFFDLETTGLGISCDITQIAAVFGTNKFSQYVMPLQPITIAASKVTGLTRFGNVLYRNGIPVPHQNSKECLKELITWLPENAVLFGHNVKSFDAKIIIKALTDENLINDFESKCNGVVDTLHVLELHTPIETCCPADQPELDKLRKEHENLKVEEVGFFINPNVPFIGASPDGIVTCDCCGQAVVEIKCPFCKKHDSLENASDDKNFYLKKDNDGNLKLYTKHMYYYQVQTQLGICQMESGYFVVWTEKDLHIEQIVFNNELWKEICDKSKHLFITAILPELIGKFYSRLPNRQPLKPVVNNYLCEKESKSKDNNEQNTE
ncbi:unnamed protein product [Mytilus coruscus]|uniref:Exonuclease domain-containing protein n=1 Tax=Mytilus coruscus TaxID=42192 RepID=A0A6J8AY88_MYTCO|nr:unnamed protein product [Mytilus coruscus]